MECLIKERIFQQGKYQKKQIDWKVYETEYKKILDDRNIIKGLDYSIFDNAVLLCSESTAEHCHRRLLAEYLSQNNNKITISHL